MRTLALAVLLAFPAFASPSQEHEHKPVLAPNAGWDKLKTLVGDWEGKNKERLSYKLVSGGTALVETLGMPEGEMVSVYHPDGASLLMTHYCAMGNQPRMRAKAGKGDTVVFSYVDATNLKGNDSHVMSGLSITFKDPDHVVEEWTSKSKAGKSEPTVFELTRKK